MATRQFLTRRQLHDLTELVLKEYTEKRLSPREFTAYAEERLGFTMTQHHVDGVLESFEIPKVHKNLTPTDAVVEALERRVSALEKRLDVYMSVGAKA